MTEKNTNKAYQIKGLLLNIAEEARQVASLAEGVPELEQQIKFGSRYIDDIAFDIICQLSNYSKGK